MIKINSLKRTFIPFRLFARKLPQKIQQTKIESEQTLIPKNKYSDVALFQEHSKASSEQVALKPTKIKDFIVNTKILPKQQTLDLINLGGLIVDGKVANAQSIVTVDSKMQIKVRVNDLDEVLSDIILMMIYKPRGVVGEITDPRKLGRPTIASFLENKLKQFNNLQVIVH